MEYDYQRCKFSITCHTDDVAVLHCLRALCQHAERGCPPTIAWGGTKVKAWLKAGNQITLRFTSPAYRQDFVEAANRLLPSGCWHEVSRNDEDPAQRQRPLA